MASIINAATSGGLVTTADTSGILQLQTAGTTAVTVDASQNVTLVGTLTAAGNITTNGGKFSLKSASVEYGSFSTASGDATLSSAASGYLKLVADGALLLGSAAGGEVFRGSSTGLRLTNSLSVGGVTPSSDGAGITFPASQSASSDANTLDDYEEGTWTPTLSSITNWTGTPTTVYAKYIKIGKSVFMEFQFNGTVTTGSTQTYFVMTLPITATSTSVSAGGMDAEGYIGLVRANAPTNCYLVIQAATSMTSGNHYPTGTATYSSAS